jgi:MoxR-like ATPase
MKIIDKREGTARFKRNLAVTKPEEFAALVKSSHTFQNRKFRTYGYGETVLATFRISETGRRYLLNVRAIKEGEDLTSTIEPEVFEPPQPKEPMVKDGFYYPPDVGRVFTAAEKLAKKLGVVTVLMVGPSGYGKTTMPMKFAEKTGRNHVRVNCAAIRDPEEWFGFREAQEGSTVFDPSEFARCIQQGNSVIVLDEVNRLEPWLHNTLFPLLDDDRGTEIHNQRFDVADNTIFVMTLNQGVEFTGTFELDQAFINRVHMTVHVGPPPEQAEIEILEARCGTKADIAKKIVRTATKLRDIIERGEADVDCSTRATIRIAQLMEAGLTIREAFHDVIESASGDIETRKRMTDQINMELSTMPTTSKVKDNVFDK